MEFLERCTCDLKETELLKNDNRFIKMWIEYVIYNKIALIYQKYIYFLCCIEQADSVRNPGEIFQFMHSNKIGDKSAIFWISWAFTAEKAQNFTLTDQIFQKGIKK
jgi:hypothetical protein